MIRIVVEAKNDGLGRQVLDDDAVDDAHLAVRRLQHPLAAHPVGRRQERRLVADAPPGEDRIAGPGREEQRERDPVDARQDLQERAAPCPSARLYKAAAAPIAPAAPCASRRAQAATRRRASRLEPPRAERGEHEHAAGDRQVLQEADLLRPSAAASGTAQKLWKMNAGEQREDGEREDDLAREEADHQRQAAAELDDDRQRRDAAAAAAGPCWRCSRRCRRSRRSCEAGQDEDQAEQDAADEDGGVLEVKVMVVSEVEDGGREDVRQRGRRPALRPAGRRPIASRLSPSARRRRRRRGARR